MSGLYNPVSTLVGRIVVLAGGAVAGFLTDPIKFAVLFERAVAVVLYSVFVVALAVHFLKWVLQWILGKIR